MTTYEKRKNPYDRYALGIVIVAILCGVAVWSILDPNVYHRLRDDFWPVDRSFVGPNLLASIVQWALIAAIVSVVYPPIRHAIAHFIERHVDSIKGHISLEHQKASRERELMHRKLDHVIKHSPDIPDFPTTKPRKATAKLPKE